MNAFPGVFVPDSMIKPLAEASKEDRPKRSIELMAEFIREIRPMCQGIHIMAMGWEKYVGANGSVLAMDHFGASGPYSVLEKEFGYTVENVVAKAKAMIG